MRRGAHGGTRWRPNWVADFKFISRFVRLNHPRGILAAILAKNSSADLPFVANLLGEICNSDCVPQNSQAWRDLDADRKRAWALYMRRFAASAASALKGASA